LFSSPWRAIACRWCRATLSSGGTARIARDLVLIVALCGASWWAIRLMQTRPGPIGLLCLIGVWLGIWFGCWVLDIALPLTTLIPRDSRRSRPR
jgi:hypothetical protein